MSVSPVMSITDELVAELERECRRGADDHGGMDNDYDSALFDRIGDTLLALLAERAELKRDADKYRKLRDGADWPAVFASSDAPEPLRDDDLDAAMELQS